MSWNLSWRRIQSPRHRCAPNGMVWWWLSVATMGDTFWTTHWNYQTDPSRSKQQIFLWNYLSDMSILSPGQWLCHSGKMSLFWTFFWITMFYILQYLLTWRRPPVTTFRLHRVQATLSEGLEDSALLRACWSRQLRLWGHSVAMTLGTWDIWNNLRYVTIWYLISDIVVMFVANDYMWL